MVTKKYTASNICKMIEFLVDNMYVRFGGQLFEQTAGIPMGTNRVPLLADLFLYFYWNEFLDNSLRRTKESLLESSISHIVTCILMTLSLSIIKDLRISSLTNLQQILYRARYGWYSNNCLTFIQWCSAPICSTSRSNKFHIVRSLFGLSANHIIRIGRQAIASLS